MTDHRPEPLPLRYEPGGDLAYLVAALDRLRVVSGEEAVEHYQAAHQAATEYLAALGVGNPKAALQALLADQAARRT